MEKRSVLMSVWAITCTTGFIFGSAFAGVLGYDNFKLTNVVTGVLAFIALVVAYQAKAPERPDAEIKPSGIKQILTSVEFMTVAASNLVVGFQFTGITALFNVVMNRSFGLNELALGMIAIAMASSHFGLMFFMKRMVISLGVPRLIATCYGLTAIVCLTLMLKPVEENMYASGLNYGAAALCLPIGMVCGNLLAPLIADKYGTNARGTTIGFLRMIFNVGQAIGPAYGERTPNRNLMPSTPMP
jgi:Na+/melibiose symporter-like transporter